MQHFPDDIDSQTSVNSEATVPGVRDMLTKLISLPSISSASAEWDRSCHQRAKSSSARS